MSDYPNFPDLTQHIAVAGMTGSGKSVAALDMLSRRLQIPWWIFDHKHDKDNIARLPGERHRRVPLIMPKSGVHIFTPKLDHSQDYMVEEILEKAFKAGKTGIYIDEGHLMHKSPAVRAIMVAGRSKKVPMMWVSQKAAHIDPFIWSQSTFFRVFKLQTNLDIKRYQENVREKFEQPELYHSNYYDALQDKVFYMVPSDPIEKTIERIDNAMRKEYGRL